MTLERKLAWALMLITILLLSIVYVRLFNVG